MKKKIVIYTCITGYYDTPFDNFERKDDYDYILFSDVPLKTNSWQNVVYDWKETGELTTTQKQRYIKTHPHKLFKNKYDLTVWVDGNTNINDKLYEYIANNSGNTITFKKHPRRDCIYVEADVVNKCKKDSPEICKKVKEFLKKEQYPENNGLYETNIILSHPKEKDVKKLFNTWWRNILKLSNRDQLSLNYTIWKLKLENIITCVASLDFPPKPHRSSKPIDITNVKTYITYFDDNQVEEYNLKADDKTILFKGNDTSYTGDSINHLNTYYCELCTMYYIWKNNLQSDFIVFEQYRRPFDWKIFGKLPDKGEIIAYKPIKISKTILVQYAICHGVKRYHDLKTVIRNLYGKDSKEFKYFTEEHIFYTNNTMVIQWDDFVKMCEFVFSVLLTMDENYQLNMDADRYEMNAIMFTEDYNYDYQRHWMAYIGERLVSCYIYNNLKVITTERPKEKQNEQPNQ